ncbi:MAG: type II toxin-antitoxin system VapC family toxin [Desulfurococcus sp.]|nr:type II toxin-antitoxin system VapC family toxin [Desulfurococcus sp.]
MSRYVIDAGVLALYFAGDERVKNYMDRVLRGIDEGYICEVNLAEFYYKTGEILGVEVADIRYISIRNSRIKLVPVQGELTRQAAKYKIMYGRKISLADAFLIALAKKINGIVLTTDKRIKEVLEDKCIYFSID